ncbi:MAG TPA: hypothetical protein VGP82_06555 [Ktedonobacterales bacterium]|jgi:DNA-binding response OmpR family regulator|nr:hypothetical protein [Ktedonobacterales bacterium]
MQPTPIILIVSADATTRHLLASYLEGEGYALLTAYDGQGAREAAQHNRVALVLVAIRQVEAADVELCTQLRTYGGGDRPSILLLLSDASDASRFGVLGFTSQQVFPLPIARTELRARVHRALRATRWGRRVRSNVLQKHQEQSDRILVAGDLVIDRDRRESAPGWASRRRTAN